MFGVLQTIWMECKIMILGLIIILGIASIGIFIYYYTFITREKYYKDYIKRKRNNG
jgi:hypothetical protein